MELTPEQFDAMCEADRLTQIACALIAKRVTATSVTSGTSKGGAGAIAADAKLIAEALAKA